MAPAEPEPPAAPAPTAARGHARAAAARQGLAAVVARVRRRAAPGLFALATLAALWLLGGSDDGRRTWPRPAILQAIRMVESGGNDLIGDGDGGRAIGPYQIHEVYWRDATAHDPGLGGDYQDCRDRAYAERVVAAYMERYAAAAWRRGDAQTIARVHNGGPLGAAKPATLGYWRRVRANLP
ncbi:MAG: hypothetical protein ACK6DT_19530 [Planctomycetota bacterium]